MKLIVLILCMILFRTNYGFSQRGHAHHGGQNGGRVRNNRADRLIVRSSYRPVRIDVYHPHWRPNYGYHRRWVYFPRYNFYWDNWRQGYYYRNGTVWIFNATPPPVVINVNLDKEINYELKEEDDDIDDVYKTNNSHLKTFKIDTVK